MTAVSEGGGLVGGRSASTGPPPAPAARPVGSLAFLGVAVASLGGPLALAALYAPAIVATSSASSGLVVVAGTVAFGVPLLVWVRYARQVASTGGLYAFVEAAAGHRVAMVHAVLWIASYTLYLAYTTVAIVYDTLPTVLPSVLPYRPLLEIAVPVVLAAIMLAGRTVTLAVLGTLAAGQLLLVATLAGVGIGHDAPAGSFALSAPAGSATGASAQVALLYVCGSLPLYLGGEVARPRRTVPRGLIAAWSLVGALVTAAVFPVAANPAFTRAPIPGMSIAEVFAGHRLAVAIGLGVAASTAGVMLVEYLALSRLLHVLTARPTRTVTVALAAVLVGSAPLTLIDPERIYGDLLKPSLIALWLSQLVVFAVYPRFASARGSRRRTDVPLALGGVLFAVYGMVATLRYATT